MTTLSLLHRWGLREDLAEKTERGVLALMSVFFPHDVGFVISETTAK